jgi:four helix bundle protein
VVPVVNDERASRTHRDLPVWQEAMSLAECVYEITADFPDAEVLGLAAQLRRSAVAIASSIAEGAARSSTGELGHFLGIALGSTAELETQIELARRFDYIANVDEATSLLESVRKQLIVFRRSLKS